MPRLRTLALVAVVVVVTDVTWDGTSLHVSFDSDMTYPVRKAALIALSVCALTMQPASTANAAIVRVDVIGPLDCESRRTI